MLARDFELAALVLDFVEQADILDGNPGLVGEGLRKLDLLFGERPTVSRISTMTPTGLPSRNSGTPSTVRNPIRFCTSCSE